ncbi:DUF5348 domain-containing protein [Bacillus sp. FJAT-47783]|uniref:DUF5348 domain-containing protein n=1 Tax=Bacillus sp. FJAT-47783 TaxID=2922712 RepID=UPI001FAE0D77|nr:DUF5348 domain-containing protein [Bacillus sp. FJAT-47783]
MKRGLLIYSYEEHEWRVWIGQRSFYINQGDHFEVRIQNKYYHAYLEKAHDWFITLSQDTKFILHPYEVYKIRINSPDYIPVDAPF